MKKFSGFLILLLFEMCVYGQPEPGDIFREYTWATPEGSRERFLRVCGDGYYDDHTRKGEGLFPAGVVTDGWFSLPDDIDLNDAIKAEVLVERMLCHDGSTGLAVKFNDGAWHAFPDADSIPKPQDEYLYHYYPIVELPMNELKTGAKSNRFRFTINPKQRWGMPQNMVYGMVVRIYYKNSKPHTTATISGVKTNDKLGDNVQLSVQSKGNFTKVEYIGLMENINYEGDGRYFQWHYHYHRGDLMNHIGTSATGNFTWNTEWVPDQPKPFQLAARVTNAEGIIYMTQPVENLQFERSFSVELCKPYNIPRRWATREMEFVSAFDVKGDLTKAEKFLVTAVTWSPGYLNGVYLNDFLILDRESCRYCYHIIRREYTESAYLNGMNSLKTGKTPFYKGKMVHGTEIQYPGFMVLVKYKK
ncbi:MAG: hypothetical protein EP310_04555 [Bacteroidetes bacterium]|nr:MAG: hypothetical protein EP310_04555 [Bacteroidota bacterium]